MDVKHFTSRSGRWDGWYAQIGKTRWVGPFSTEDKARTWLAGRVA
jgi:hypothetical protein